MHLEQCFLHCFNRCFYVFPASQMLNIVREVPLGAFSTDGSAPFLSSAASSRVRKGSCISPSFILACQSPVICILTIKLSRPLLTHVLNSSFKILSLWRSTSAVNVCTTLKSLKVLFLLIFPHRHDCLGLNVQLRLISDILIASV